LLKLAAFTIFTNATEAFDIAYKSIDIFIESDNCMVISLDTSADRATLSMAETKRVLQGFRDGFLRILEKLFRFLDTCGLLLQYSAVPVHLCSRPVKLRNDGSSLRFFKLRKYNERIRIWRVNSFGVVRKMTRIVSTEGNSVTSPAILINLFATISKWDIVFLLIYENNKSRIVTFWSNFKFVTLF